MLKKMCGKTKNDQVRNENICRQVGIAPIEIKLRENHLQWFNHLEHKSRDAPVRKMKKIDISQSKRLGDQK